jgi:hypothetical protein
MYDNIILFRRTIMLITFHKKHITDHFRSNRCINSLSIRKKALQHIFLLRDFNDLYNFYSISVYAHIYFCMCKCYEFAQQNKNKKGNKKVIKEKDQRKFCRPMFAWHAHK